jgi:hypothetical protein
MRSSFGSFFPSFLPLPALRGVKTGPLRFRNCSISVSTFFSSPSMTAARAEMLVEELYDLIVLNFCQNPPSRFF